MVICTVHAYERSEERMNIWSTDEAFNNAKRAWINGKTVDDYSGKTRRFLLNKEKSHDDFTEIRIFKGFCYIFKKNGICVTVYKAPKWMFKPNRPKRPRFRGEDEFFASDYEGIYFNTEAFGTHCVLFLIQIS